MTLALPTTFTFSQSSLQAYADCPRRFWLAYVAQLPWPAVEASPVQEHEDLMRLGELFHRLVERTEIGIDAAQVAVDLAPPLSTWYDAYLSHRPADLPPYPARPEAPAVEVERVLSIPFGAGGVPEQESLRLAAKYDLLAAPPEGPVIIVDWKTARRRSSPVTLRQRLQTVVYPYVLVEASAALPWGPVPPERVEMRYWFAAAPSQPVIFRYDAAQHESAHRRLQDLRDAILAGRDESDFPKVEDTEANRQRLCAFCVYRSRCGRGQAAGSLDSLDTLDDAADFFTGDALRSLDFSLDEVAELSF